MRDGWNLSQVRTKLHNGMADGGNQLTQAEGVLSHQPIIELVQIWTEVQNKWGNKAQTFYRDKR